MQILQTILYIIIFLLCLSFVVCIHEAGHLLVAKICNVYCFEYSIGFGPLIFKHKGKHKKKKTSKDILTENLFEAKEDEYESNETQFSIRALPLGGYVAMAGEDGNLSDDGTVVPKERCLNGVNHFKQICIMLAGITMNFILALVLFMASAWLPQTQNVLTSNEIVVVDDSYASKQGLLTGDKIISLYQEYKGLKSTSDEEIHEAVFPVEVDRNKISSYQKVQSNISTATTYDDLTNDCISYASQDIFTNFNYNFVDTEKKIPGFDLNKYDSTYSTSYSSLYATVSSTRTFHITVLRNSEEVELTISDIKTVAGDDEKSYYKFDTLGITCKTRTYQNSFIEGVEVGARNFGSLFVGLYTTMGSLFTPSGWKNVGGIISVYKMSAEGVSSHSLSYFLLLWGYISLNLGCFNLLPFPGLDGWQTLLALIESASRKKIPSKVKNIANSVGLIIMLLLAGLLIVKDIITL